MDEQKEMKIEVRPEIAKGTYSNLAIISHSNSEFIVDFAANLPGQPGPQVVSRIVMPPAPAKRRLRALQDNVNKYEANFGNIMLPGMTFKMGGNNNGSRS